MCNCRNRNKHNKIPCDNIRDRCIECLSCLQTKQGTISASLIKASSPTLYDTVGQIITYSYTIKNTGTAIIKNSLIIKDDKLGPQLIPFCVILPNLSQVFIRTYTITADDLLQQSITNAASVEIEINEKQSVCSNSSSSTITFGAADLSGTITQEPGLDSVGVLITINNSGSSSTVATNVQLFLPYPLGVTESDIFLRPAIPPASAVVITPTGIVISQPNIPISATYQYFFVYTAIPGNAYTWAGNITSQSFDPDTTNNRVTSTIVYNGVSKPEI